MSMSKHKKKNNLNFYICFWSFLIIFFTYAYVSQTMKIRNYYVVKSEIIEDIESVRLDYIRLQSELQNTESYEFFERLAREELGMVKSNEIVFRIR